MRLSDAECPNCGETWCEMRHSYACYMRANVKLRASVAELEAQLARQAPVIEAARRQLAAVSDHMPPSPEEWVRWVAATDEVHRTIAVLDGKE